MAESSSTMTVYVQVGPLRGRNERLVAEPTFSALYSPEEMDGQSEYNMAMKLARRMVVEKAYELTKGQAVEVLVRKPVPGEADVEVAFLRFAFGAETVTAWNMASNELAEMDRNVSWVKAVLNSFTRGQAAQAAA